MGDENVEPSEETNLAASKLQASIRGHQERANPTKPPLKASAAAPGSAGGAPVIVQNDADEQWPPYADPEYVMPETIEVLVLGPDGKERASSTVGVAKCTTRKPYLGGYRHKKTGKVYHHASCQSAEFGLLPQRKNLLELKRQKPQVLQCFWRGYLARRRTWGIRQRLYDAQVAEERGADEAGRAASRRRQFEVERRINPRSAKDFELLYNELEAWRAKEMERVRAIPDATPGDVKAAMSGVLAKETKALQTIDRLKAQAAKEGKARRVERVMELMAFPKKWEAGDGELQEVHTPFTTRAQELRDLYRGLATDRLPPDERLQILLNVKWTVQEFACPLTHDIVELCDREADLLNRGRNEKSLEGLRKRTETLFQQFIETPDFNPESTRFLKVPTLRQMNATLAPTAE
ncbi:smoothened signaling pathway protein [Aureococcus anophagefferens]|uniref:Smoothened signaling pathway protein n=1 Tax=Aureococcus anophagefferens TaxID=44056 RepID=A0ABR1GC64_AURAN